VAATLFASLPPVPPLTRRFRTPESPGPARLHRDTLWKLPSLSPNPPQWRAVTPSSRGRRV